MKLFISYSSRDRTIVAQVVTDLEVAGHEVWFDQELTGGREWWADILQNIRECDAFLFALSPDSLDSYPCQLEYDYAHKLNKRILPLHLRTVNVERLAVPLQTLQIIDYREGNKEQALHLIRTLYNLPAGRNLPHPLPNEPEIPIHPIQAIKDRIKNSSELDGTQQRLLVAQLEDYLEDVKLVRQVKSLLKEMLERKDLLARTEHRIQSILGISLQSTLSPNTSSSFTLFTGAKPINFRNVSSLPKIEAEEIEVGLNNIQNAYFIHDNDIYLIYTQHGGWSAENEWKTYRFNINSGETTLITDQQYSLEQLSERYLYAKIIIIDTITNETLNLPESVTNLDSRVKYLAETDQIFLEQYERHQHHWKLFDRTTGDILLQPCSIEGYMLEISPDYSHVMVKESRDNEYSVYLLKSGILVNRIYSENTPSFASDDGNYIWIQSNTNIAQVIFNDSRMSQRRNTLLLDVQNSIPARTFHACTRLASNYDTLLTSEDEPPFSMRSADNFIVWDIPTGLPIYNLSNPYNKQLMGDILLTNDSNFVFAIVWESTKQHSIKTILRWELP